MVTPLYGTDGNRDLRADALGSIFSQAVADGDSDYLPVRPLPPGAEPDLEPEPPAPPPPSEAAPPALYHMPRIPEWTGNVVTFNQALDEWLIAMRGLCEDRAFVDWSLAMHGNPMPPPVAVPAYPAKGDKVGWVHWWQEFNVAYDQAGASADGIFAEERPPSHGETRNLSRDEIEDIVRDILLAELPEAIALLLKKENV
jgi:hypothetical protein